MKFMMSTCGRHYLRFVFLFIRAGYGRLFYGNIALEILLVEILRLIEFGQIFRQASSFLECIAAQPIRAKTII